MSTARVVDRSEAYLRGYADGLAQLRDGFDGRLFAIVVDMARVGTNLERYRGGTAFRAHLERMWNLIIASTDPRVPLEALDGEARARRQLAEELGNILRKFDRDAEARSIQRESPTAGPTPELYRKRRGNVIDRLRQAGKIDEREAWAAGEIQETAEQFLAGACLAVAQLHKVRVDESRRLPTSPPGAIDTTARVMRYRNWCRAINEKGWPLGPLLDVIAEGHALREVETEWKIRHDGTLADMVIDSLGLYVDLADLGP